MCATDEIVIQISDTSCACPSVVAMPCCTPTSSTSPCSQVRLRAAVEDFIQEGAAPAERMIRDLVDCEHSYINTDHPQFIGGNRALSQVQNCSPTGKAGIRTC